MSDLPPTSNLPTLSPDDLARQRKRKKDKSLFHFWRAIKYLGPHRRLVITSILCAFFVGLTFTGGLSTMLPILRILMGGEPVQTWAGRIVIEKRLGVRLTDNTESLVIFALEKKSAAGAAGIKAGDQIKVDGAGDLKSTVAALARPDRSAMDVQVVRGDQTLGQTLPLPQLPWYYAALYSAAGLVPENPVGAIAAIFGVMFMLGVIGNFIRFYQEYFSDKAAILAVNDIRRKLYDHILHIPVGFFGLKGTSDVTSRLVQDAQGLQDGFKSVLGQSIQEPIKASMALGLALWFDWQLTMFIIVFAPLMFAIIKKFGKKMRRASRAALQSSAVMLGQLESTLSGVRVIKAAGAERFERRRYGGIMGKLVDEQLKMSRIDAASTPVLEMLTLAVVGAIVLYATHLVQVKKTLDATTFFGLMACLMAIGESLRKFSKVNNALQKSNAAAARIFETLDVQVERPREMGTRGRGSGFRVQGSDAEATKQLSPVSGRIEDALSAPSLATNNSQLATLPQDSGLRTQQLLKRLPLITHDVTFEDVTFSYPGAPTPSLLNISLTVRKGQSVAVVGRNGSGKTTLLSLLPRFYNPDSGRILIDGIDISTVTLKSLRSQIGIVTQEPTLFPGTIAQNIAYGLPTASRVQIESAAKQAFAHEFIMEKPLGYDMVLEGIGSQLSGGQRQRLCIARAILRQTPILILDEATSQVDAESEHKIQQAIERLMQERTTFVIAHRFSTILSADTIIVLDRGQIVGQGKHEELLATCETYKNLYDRQVFGAAVEVA